MTVSIPENKVQDVSAQDKVDTQTSIQKLSSDPQHNVQPVTENKEEEDPNFKNFREARKKDRDARKEAEQKAFEKEQEISALKAAMEAAFSKNTQVPNTYYENNTPHNAFEEETEDQRIEKKVNALLTAKEEKQRREQEEREKQEYPNRLVKDFNDFNQVVSQENLDYIDFHYPEVSRPLQRLHDGYDKWSDIYKAIKKFVPNNTNAKKEAAKAEANFNKPKSLSSTHLTPTGENAPRSMIDVERTRAENWARMQRIMKQV